MNIALARRTERIRNLEWTVRAWQVLGGVSVRTKILGIVLALTAVLGLAVTWQVRSVMADVFMAELESRGKSVASDLAARSVEPILLNDLYSLHQLINQTVRNNPDALYAFVENADGQVLAHTFQPGGFPTGLLDPSLLAVTVEDADTHIRQLEYKSDQGRVYEFAAPISVRPEAVVRVGMTETRLTGIVNAVTGQMLLTTLGVAIFGIAAAIFLTWLLTRPILDLVATTRRVAQGDLEARSPRWANDEIGLLADAFNQMVAQLDASRQSILEKDLARTQLLQMLITAQEEERRRIARELHDGVGQVLTSFIVSSKLASELDDPEAARRKNLEMYHVAAETLEQVRMLSRQLRPSLMDDLGLAAALERYAADFAQLYPHISVELHCDLGERLPEVAETTLYRIIQEAMTNAARHSGANYVGVLAARRNGRVQAIIEDNGRGFDPETARKAAHSVGIHAMAERAELAGGRLDIESNVQGTTVYVEISL